MTNVPSSFLVSSSVGYLGSYLTTVYAPTGDDFSILAGGGNSPQQATLNALRTGEMTNGENKVLKAIAEGPSTGTSAPWNSNDTEPTTLANMRSYGWIQLVKKTTGPGGTTQGVYRLTNLGKEIYARTNGGAVTGAGASSGTSGSTISLSTADSDQAAGTTAASATSTLSSLVGTATNILGSLGVDISV